MVSVNKEKLEKDFAYQVELAWEDMTTPPDEFDIHRLRELTFRIVDRIGESPDSLNISNDYSGCIVYGGDVFIGYCDQESPRLHISSKKEAFPDIQVDPPENIPEAVVDYIKQLSEKDRSREVVPASERLTPMVLMLSKETYRAITDHARETVKKALACYPHMTKSDADSVCTTLEKGFSNQPAVVIDSLSGGDTRSDDA